MRYRYSNLDRRNLAWVANDDTCATLKRIELRHGSIRSLNKFKMELAYPITAIAGENGSGKSTLLAIAACGFHNLSNGYKLKDRSTSYYTFSDFFVQSRDEIPPQGIEIRYQIIHNHWARSDPGPAWQSRKKRVGGKWNNYDTRVKRNVVYFGINRVVPHYERSAHKSYRGRFQIGALDENHRERICDIAGRVIGKPYDEFELHTHSKYTLPITSSRGIRYSGFNMGAGESAVFEIFTALFEAGRGTLLVIDELELGLHERAQIRLVEELKALCFELHCQIICSTHSHVVLAELPPEGRFFIEARDNSTYLTPGISADHACGKLRGQNIGELDVFVEDRVSESILMAGLPHSIRGRIKVMHIGSADVVLHQLAARYLEREDDCLCILDGDQRGTHNASKENVRNYLENRFREDQEELEHWIENRLAYMPSDSWPEKWLIDSAQDIDDKSYLVTQWGMEDEATIVNALENAAQAGKHNEFHELAETLQYSVEHVLADIIRFLLLDDEDIFDGIQAKMEALLDPQD